MKFDFQELAVYQKAKAFNIDCKHILTSTKNCIENSSSLSE